MKTQDSSGSQTDPFKLFAVEASEPPGDGVPGKWFRYKITQGDNVIRGWRQGSKTAVMRELKDTVAALNERRRGRQKRVNLTPASKGKTR